jgi:hypothetical protein
MNIIMLLWWSLGHGNPVVPSRWQATTIRSREVTYSISTNDRRTAQ